jgi:DNA polymerase-3 subunit gamma/tau
MTDIDDLLDEDAPERDENTVDMFGAPRSAPLAAPPPPIPAEGQAPADGGAYTVLARKYRPRTFEDLIGQEAMVRTLRNAFATGRIAQAWMLTGVRGVGKTTTARLLARALNAERPGVDRPTVELTDDGLHDPAIMEGRHMDVLELDAATRTKVDEMRELLDSVRYAPVDARYKVVVLDEVHMLSTSSFNALLKTLEEPPPHLKFIFATTEIRKVPVTILSRCQRFDLRRVEPDVLVAHLQKVLAAEGAAVDEDGLALIARAAEGSVRDALSLLDQAIVQAEPGAPVAAEVIRDMLGLADRAATIALFETVMRGEQAEALRQFRSLYGFGADPAVVMLDVLEHCHSASIAKALGPGALSLPKEQAARLASLGAAASAGVLSRLWQMLLKAYDEVRRAPHPSAAAEMALIRLCYAADLPGPEEALRRLQAGETISAGPAPRAPSPSGGGGGGAVARAEAAHPAAAAADPRPSLQSFHDVLALIAERRDIGLKMDVERFMRPIAFRTGAIEFEPAPGTPADLTQRLARRLREWTGQPWLIAAQGGGGGETAYERQKREQAEQRAAIEADPFVREVMSVFPGAEIVAVRELATAEPPPRADADEDD